jgi:hypothetical protein
MACSVCYGITNILIIFLILRVKLVYFLVYNHVQLQNGLIRAVAEIRFLIKKCRVCRVFIGLGFTLQFPVSDTLE